MENIEGITRNRLADYIEKHGEISEENPLYAIAHLFDVLHGPLFGDFIGIGDGADDANSLGYAICRVAITGVDKGFVHMDILEANDMRGEAICRTPAVDDHLVMPFDLVSLEMMDSTAELRLKYKSLHKRRDGRNYRIRARLYEGVGTGISAAAVEGSEKEWDLTGAKLKDGSEPRDLVGAKKWLLENHPDYYMGAIIEGCTGGMDGTIIAAPAKSTYPQGEYEDARRRRKYTEDLADELDISIGHKEYRREWMRLHGGDDD